VGRFACPGQGEVHTEALLRMYIERGPAEAVHSRELTTGMAATACGGAAVIPVAQRVRRVY